MKSGILLLDMVASEYLLSGSRTEILAVEGSVDDELCFLGVFAHSGVSGAGLLIAMLVDVLLYFVAVLGEKMRGGELFEWLEGGSAVAVPLDLG